VLPNASEWMAQATTEVHSNRIHFRYGTSDSDRKFGPPQSEVRSAPLEVFLVLRRLASLDQESTRMRNVSSIPLNLLVQGPKSIPVALHVETGHDPDH
jgi:hypothetical protein